MNVLVLFSFLFQKKWQVVDFIDFFMSEFACKKSQKVIEYTYITNKKGDLYYDN